ncbi:MAG TPA: sensor histidine kinase [Caulobacterales bacterium]|nr:sensor histidine kinase [Caulobacterales bacterium]
MSELEPPAPSPAGTAQSPDALAPPVAGEEAGGANFFSGFRRLIRRSLAARLVSVAIVSIVGLVLVGVVAQGQFNKQLTRLLIDPEISGVIDNLIASSGPDPLSSRIALQDIPFDPRYQRPTSKRYYEIAHLLPGDRLDYQLKSPSLFDVYIVLTPQQVERLAGPDARRGVVYFDIPRGPDNEPLRAAARITQIPNLEGRYVFIVAVATRDIIAPAATLVSIAFAAFVAFCALMVAAVTSLQMRIGLEPMSRLRRDIADVRRGQKDRLTGDYAAELEPVAEELNALVDHNREVVERARRHVGNLAHALKTPIAVLKNAAAEQGGGEAVMKQSIEEMESFVERQLRRARVAARAEATAGPQSTTIGYRTPVRQNLEDLIFMMEQKYDHVKALDIQLDAEADVTFRGEREDLLEMAANLIDNACKYGRSQVIVHLAPPAERAGLLEILVEDDGPGLSDEQVQRVLAARGTRLDEAAPGQGLGLSILKETVDLYAGQLVFERSDLGGLKARLRLPATD